MKRYLLVTLLALALILGCTAGAMAADNITVMVNGQKVSFDQQPVLENGRTLVPVAAIFTALGATNVWDGATKTVTSTKGGIEIVLTIGSDVMYKNNQAIQLDVPAKIINGRTMVPLRAVGESFNCEVLWLQASKTAVVSPILVKNVTAPKEWSRYSQGTLIYNYPSYLLNSNSSIYYYDSSYVNDLLVDHLPRPTSTSGRNFDSAKGYYFTCEEKGVTLTLDTFLSMEEVSSFSYNSAAWNAAWPLYAMTLNGKPCKYTKFTINGVVTDAYYIELNGRNFEVVCSYPAAKAVYLKDYAMYVTGSMNIAK